MTEQEYRIPDLLCDWPWTRRLSPHYAVAKRESSGWISSFHPFDERGQKCFDACDLNLLASLTYSNRDKDFVRLGCDLMNFYFVYDEYTDVANPSVAAKLGDEVLEVMKNTGTSSTQSTHLLAEMTRQFMRQSESIAAPGSHCFERFVQTSETYFKAVTQEAHDRADKRVRNLGEYMNLRRDTSGARPTLVLIEFGLDLPDFVTSHPTIVSLMEDAVDLIILVNDMHSYVREISCGLAYHNIVTVIMDDYDLDLQGALDWLSEYTDRVVARFLSNLERVPSWGPDVDHRVRIYLEGLGQWVRGNDDWSCEGKRYHGDDGMKIKETRMITIRPRTANYLTLGNDTLEISTTLSQLRGRIHLIGLKLRGWWSLCSGGLDIRNDLTHYSILKWISETLYVDLR